MISCLYKGFTLIELIVVILIVGILSAFVLPRINFSAFEETGFFQQSITAIRFSQKLAISSGCVVQVDIDSPGCFVTWSDCGAGSPANGTSVSNPATGLSDFCDNSSASTVTGAVFTFDRIGRPSASPTITIGTQQIQVEAETGYTREI